MQNKISFSIDEKKLGKALEALRVLDESLTGLIVLTEDDRDALPKYGDKSMGFVEKALEFGKQRPDLLPTYFSLEEMEKDMKARTDLRKLLSPVKSLTEKIYDSYLLTGSEAFLAALRIYDNLKKADHDGVPGLTFMIEELQKRFPGRSTSMKKAKQV